MRIGFLAAVAALLLSSPVLANQKALAVEQIVSQQQQIRQDVIAAKGRYGDMPASKREQLLDKQSALLSMLEGKASTAELDETQRIEAFNTLEWIEAAINDEDKERMVCIREKTIGSNRVTRTCRTESQWAEARERAREQLSRGGACADLGQVGCTGG
jgi:hypothetical protein